MKIRGDEDPLAQLALGQAYFAAGDKEKARKAGKTAIEAAASESAGLKRYIEGEVRRFDDSSDNKAVPAEIIRPAKKKEDQQPER